MQAIREAIELESRTAALMRKAIEGFEKVKLRANKRKRIYQRLLKAIDKRDKAETQNLMHELRTTRSLKINI